MDIFELKEILKKSYTKDTCWPILREKWSVDNPTLGQGAITALLVNELYGGKIMRCLVSYGGHYYNLIDDKIVDLTKEQFLGEIPGYNEGQERTREYLLSNEDTKNRYLLLKNNLEKTKEEDDMIRNKRYKTCVKQRKINIER